MLEAAGFEHYEISNFARPGQRRRHNEVYWANEAYFGFGMGAARYVKGRRELNTRDLNAYIRRNSPANRRCFKANSCRRWNWAQEAMAVQWRRTEGIYCAVFRTQTGFDLDTTANPAPASLVEQGLLEDDGVRVRLSRRGKYVADGVIERLL